ncbi:MAG: Flp pilus assembly complex ATPase component TadA, partial [Bdellovibrionales bacterium]|nr:Flp pilus assembly complex ATPase component TadA [Bdellovibrionales bacterium]
MAIQASLTGHFVLSTIHTNDASSAPNRLIDMGVQPFLIASSLAGVLAQRLIRTLCNDCKEAYSPGEYDFQMLDVHSIPPEATLFRTKGCPKCNFLGYAGMTVVSELLIITDEIRPLILKKSDANTVKKVAMKHGMKSLRQDALEKVFKGITSVEEMTRAINEEDEDVQH